MCKTDFLCMHGSMECLLTPIFFAYPGQQQHCCWLYKITGPCLPSKKAFNFKLISIHSIPIMRNYGKHEYIFCIYHFSSGGVFAQGVYDIAYLATSANPGGVICAFPGYVKCKSYGVMQQIKTVVTKIANTWLHHLCQILS